jgi:hypothetical protein
MSNGDDGARSSLFYDGPADPRRDYGPLRCSFCGLGEGRVAHLFEGRSGYICNDCVRVCAQLLADYREAGFRPSLVKAPWYRRWLGDERALAACNFCGALCGVGGRLLAGPDSQICEQCVRTCEAIDAQEV